MPNFKFIHQKDIILDLYNQGKTYKEISDILKTPDFNSQQNIRRLIKHYIPNAVSNKIVITKDIKTKIIKLIHKGMKPFEIAKHLNLNSRTVYSSIKRIFKNIKFVPEIKNNNYFDIINTHSKAYILGFICADGSLVYSRKYLSLTITIKYEDKNILEFIKQELDCTHKLLEIKRKSSFDKKKIIHHIRLSISNKKLVSDIMKYGITPRKTYTLQNIINNIPHEFRDSFIIGYFDGDGSVTINNNLRMKKSNGKYYPNHSVCVNIRGTYDILYGICTHLDINVGRIKKYDSTYVISFNSKKDIMRFFKCYDNLKFYYVRKHDIFLKRIYHKSYDKYR